MPVEVRIVDWLPEVLWSQGNLLILPGGSLHFCTSPSTPERSVRTIEWDGKELARGRKAVDFEALRTDGPVVLVSLRQVAEVVAAGVLLVLVLRRRHS